MAVRSKPKPTQAKGKQRTSADALIRKGGSVASSGASSPRTSVLLRLEPELLERIDAVRDQRVIKITRTQWILEAIAEKLGNEGY